MFEGTYNRQELQNKLGLASREHFRKAYLQAAIDLEFVALTIPEKPKSSNLTTVIGDVGLPLIHSKIPGKSHSKVLSLIVSQIIINRNEYRYNKN